MSDNINLLHVYGAEAWHESVFIVGNRKGLQALRNAIDDALKAEPGGKGFGTRECMVSDGEGYQLHVSCFDHDWQHPDWKEIAMPYTANIARDRRENLKHPAEFQDD